MGEGTVNAVEGAPHLIAGFIAEWDSHGPTDHPYQDEDALPEGRASREASVAEPAPIPELGSARIVHQPAKAGRTGTGAATLIVLVVVVDGGCVGVV